MAFAQLVQPNLRFQLALDVLLPILDSNKPAEVRIRSCQCIQTVDDFSDFSLIASPADFSLIYSVFTLCASSCHGWQPLQVGGTLGCLKDGKKAIRSIANEGGVSPDEPLVWVLWRILRGDGNDVSILF
jgi:hypothetical protein